MFKQSGLYKKMRHIGMNPAHLRYNMFIIYQPMYILICRVPDSGLAVNIIF